MVTKCVLYDDNTCGEHKVLLFVSEVEKHKQYNFMIQEEGNYVAGTEWMEQSEIEDIAIEFVRKLSENGAKDGFKLRIKEALEQTH